MTCGFVTINMADRMTLGKRGEEEAARHLRKSGYKILGRNVRTPLGEIDIVASDKGTLCFIEVRARSGLGGSLAALESVGRQKQIRLSRLASWYLKEKKMSDSRVRFDVVAFSPDEASCFCLVRGAFDFQGGF